MWGAEWLELLWQSICQHFDCQVLQAERLPDQLSDDDLAFWSYVVEEQRPKSVAEAHMDYSDDEQESDEEGEVEEESEEEGMDIDWLDLLIEV